MRKFLRLLLAAISGAGLALCFEPFNASWIVWGWLWLLLPLLWTVGGKWKKLRGFGLGYLCGLVFWLLNLKWIWTVTGVGAVAFAIYLALYFGAFGAFAASAGNPWKQGITLSKGMGARFREMAWSLGYAVALGGFWCGLEWARGIALTGFGWNGLGVSFANSLILAQNAEFVGVIGLSFLPVFFSAVVVQVARRFYRQAVAGGVKLLHWDFAVALGVVMIAFTLGAMRYSAVKNAEKFEGRALLIQQNIPQVAGQVSWPGDRIVRGLMELTEAGLAEADASAVARLKIAEKGEAVEIPRPHFVVWPEACLPAWFFEGQQGLKAGPEIESALNYVMSLGEFTLLTGMNEVVPTNDPEAPEVYNSLLVHQKSGERQTFRKHHLVYFGEAIPEVDFLRALYRHATGVDFGNGLSAGQDFDPLKAMIGDEAVSIIPSICFEDTVPRVERRFVRDEPQVMVNVTNDGWFRESEAAAQHFQNALFRSIELRRPMLRCANQGVTAIVSPTGSTVDPITGEERRLRDEKGSHFHRGFLLRSFYVPKDAGVTFYARFGDWFALAGLGMAFLWVGLLRLRRR